MCGYETGMYDVIVALLWMEQERFKRVMGLDAWPKAGDMEQYFVAHFYGDDTVLLAENERMMPRNAEECDTVLLEKAVGVYDQETRLKTSQSH